MSEAFVIETERLRLRTWRDADAAAYAAMLGDAEVRAWLGLPVPAEEIPGRMARFNAAFAEVGFTRFAVERREDGVLIGHCGLAPVREAIAFSPSVEIGWALAREAWGQGFATEAARAALADGFERLRLDRIYAYTAQGNVRSQAVMRRLAMIRRADLDFDHPALAEDDPLRPHCVYAIELPLPA